MKSGYKVLYKHAIQSTRSGPLFNAFPYPTKISPEAAALFIASHTLPGELVLDCFGGSGTTGLGAILCASPTDKMRDEVKRLGLPVTWGPRRAVLYELGVLGAFISQVLCHPPDPNEFREAAESLLTNVRNRWAWLYKSHDPEGEMGEIRYVVWSDLLVCPKCGKEGSLWDGCVSCSPAAISRTFQCPHCHSSSTIDQATHVRETVHDDLLGQDRSVRKRVQAWVYGQTGGRTWSRVSDTEDGRFLARANATPLPSCVPVIAVPWGDLYRSGYHEGMSHLHHFYTRRNLLAFSALWQEAENFPEQLQPALRFWLLSYNSAHSTIMTRVVAKKGQDDLVVTSAQPGVLYVSGLPVEKNIFAGVQRKIGTMARAFAVTHAFGGGVEVLNASSLDLDLPSESVDYVFTDPPFGGNIPYAEVNFLNEAWLGQTTDPKEEAIVSPHQDKSVEDYQELLRRAFAQAHRVLKPQGHATVVFHSASAEIWNALRKACEQAGFGVADTSVLDKTQGSFKQVRTTGAVKGDPIILLSKSMTCGHVDLSDVWAVASALVDQALRSDDPTEVTPQRLYSRLVAYYLEARQDVPVDAGTFYRMLAKRHKEYAARSR